MGRMSRLLLAAVTTVALAGCGAGSDDDPTAAEQALQQDTSESATDGVQPPDPAAVRNRPLRKGEDRLTLAMPEAYTPSPPTGVGTDDYRCFLLDPGLTEDAFLTGTNVLPGNADVVHHVILFRVPPDLVGTAEEIDAEEEGQGWTCFGGPGVESIGNLEDAPWLGAWAPGGRESVHRRGYGVKLEAGTRIVMQVHYNLLKGESPDISATQLRLAPAKAELEEIHTILMPAPVEMPCRPAHVDGPLCDRDAALADVKARFGAAGNTADLLHLLCGGKVRPGNVQSCTRTISEPTTIRGVAGHMHLLGRSLKIEVNPGTDRARTILDIPVWDFDDQGARPIRPVRLEPWDTVRITCRHVQWLRDELPSFEGQPDRYIVWGEGSTDEMCLGMLQVTRP